MTDNIEINDIRTAAQFKGTSFSKYKKTDVRKQLIENVKNGKLEPACYWSAELICAGHYMELWEIILHYVGKHIHLGNPKIVVYLEKRFEIYRNIISQGQYMNELQLGYEISGILFIFVMSLIMIVKTMLFNMKRRPLEDPSFSYQKIAAGTLGLVICYTIVIKSFV